MGDIAILQQSSVEFVPGDQGHQPRDHRPRTGQCGENCGEDHPRFMLLGLPGQESGAAKSFAQSEYCGCGPACK